MTVRSIDLHLHSTASDGTFTPTELVEAAAAAGLVAISLSDHDSVGGIEEARIACARHGIELVTGVELSADVPDGDCHILGYHVDAESPSLLDWLHEQRRRRVDRAGEIVRQVNRELRARGGAAAPQIAWDAVARRANLAGGGAVGRPHVADELLAVGAVASRHEAFRTLLGDGMAGDVPRERVSPEGVIKVIRKAGGVAVLAHPTYVRGFEQLLPVLVAAGLGGLECIYGDYAPEVVAGFEALARNHRLVITGGSDFHGPGTEAGSARIGVPTVPAHLLEPLAARASSRPA